MSMKEEYRIKVLEVPKELAGAFGELDDGTHLSGLGQNGVHGFTVVEDREDGYVPVALTVFSKKEAALTVEWLYVSEDSRGNGYGERLLYELFLVAKKENIEEVRIRIPEDYAYLENFFLDNGFSMRRIMREWIIDGARLVDDFPEIEEMPEAQAEIVTDLDNEVECVIKNKKEVTGRLRLVKNDKTWVNTAFNALDVDAAEALLLCAFNKIMDKIMDRDRVCFVEISDMLYCGLWIIFQKNNSAQVMIYSAPADLIDEWR